VGNTEKVLRSEDKGQGRDHTKCRNGESMHFNSVSLRITCYFVKLKVVPLCN